MFDCQSSRYFQFQGEGSVLEWDGFGVGPGQASGKRNDAQALLSPIDKAGRTPKLKPDNGYSSYQIRFSCYGFSPIQIQKYCLVTFSWPPGYFAGGKNVILFKKSINTNH